MAVWAIGVISVMAALTGQVIFPFAFDFVSTLAVFGVGVFVGKNS